MKKFLKYLTVIGLAAFGMLTLFLSSSIILDLFGIRAKEGNYVLLVVWANFLCSLLYLSAAYGFLKSKKWTLKLLIASAIILVAAYIGLFIHIKLGGNYETKTIGALLFRTTVTLVFAAIAYFTISKNNEK